MVRIKMLQTRYGTEDGFGLDLYRVGEEYEVQDSMGSQFISSGFAEVAGVPYITVFYPHSGLTRRQVDNPTVRSLVDRNLAVILDNNNEIKEKLKQLREHVAEYKKTMDGLYEN